MYQYSHKGYIDTFFIIVIKSFQKRVQILYKTKNGESFLGFLRFSSETRDWTGDLMIMNHAL